jgi:hypothetical protein
MVRILNTLLLLIAVVGVFFAWQAHTKFEPTRREHERLTAKVGRLPIEDATKVHVLAIETKEPLDFAWQVHVPANFDWKWQTTQFQHNTSTSSGKVQASRVELVRVRFRKIDGQWHVWNKMLGSSGVTSSSDAELLERPELLHIEQLGVGKLTAIEPDEVVTLLNITGKQPSRPEDPATTAFLGRFGSRAAWAKQPSKGQ